MTGIMRIFVVLSVAAGTFLLAAFCLFPASGHAAERQMLWQSREQFVALEPRDNTVTGPPEQNGHPATLTIDQLTTLLAAVQFTAGKNTAAEPLFTGQALETLTPQLVLGLQKATPGEDLTFAIISLHRALLGLAKEPRVTTGRLFIRDGKLNLIVGLAQRDVNEREDRRLAPFTPGSRQTPASGEWTLQLPEDAADVTLRRRDWITIPTNWKPHTATTSSTPATTTGAPTGTGKSTAERLIILKDLLEKGLIDKHEYQNKRQEILQAL
jgi:hypothetical protein